MSKRIALMYGGASSEHEVSVMGYKYVSSLLKNTPYEILPIYIGRCGDWHVGDSSGAAAYPSAYGGGSLYTEYGHIGIDAAIPLLHGSFGEDGCIQGALEVLGIPYVGADVSASALCIDKYYTKLLASSLGIPTLECVRFSSRTDAEYALNVCVEKLGFPMFIKPRRLGSSLGAHPVYDEGGFKAAFTAAMDEGDSFVIVEKMLTDKRELECAFCELGRERIITPPGEVLIGGFYGYGEKYSGNTVTRAVADISPRYSDAIRDLSRKIADALRLRHLSRIDFFMSGGEVYLNEVNTFPGFTRDSLYPKMLEAAGIHPRDALLSFVEDALSC